MADVEGPIPECPVDPRRPGGRRLGLPHGRRDQVEECHRLSQGLRTENAQLKDQVLALRSQNQDLSERAVDDIRRMAQLEDVNRQLETSVQAYQDERGRLESAYKELAPACPARSSPCR